VVLDSESSDGGRENSKSNEKTNKLNADKMGNEGVKKDDK